MPIIITDLVVSTEYAYNNYTSENRYTTMQVRGRDSLATDSWSSLVVNLSPEQCKKVAEFAAKLIYQQVDIQCDYDIPADAVDPVKAAEDAEREAAYAQAEADAAGVEAVASPWDTTIAEDNRHDAADHAANAAKAADDMPF